MAKNQNFEVIKLEILMSQKILFIKISFFSNCNLIYIYPVVMPIT